MRAVLVGRHIPVGYSPMSYFFEFFKQARSSPREVWRAGVKRKPRTLIRSMKNGPRLLTKYNKTQPELTLWLNFDFWCFPAFLVLQREFHYFINTVLSDNGLIVSCTKSYVKLVATSQRMMKSASNFSSTNPGVTTWSKSANVFLIELNRPIMFY